MLARHLSTSLKFKPALHRDTRASGLSWVDICADAITAYRAHKVAGEVPDSSVWNVHSSRAQSAFFKLLETGSPEQLAEYVSLLHERPLLHGYVQHHGITRKLDEEPERHQVYATKILLGLFQLGSALGCLRHLKPEQSDNFDYLKTDQTDEIAQDCATALGIEGAFPQSGPGLYALSTARGILSQRHVLALGYLREIRNTLEFSGRRYDQVVEIGGGLGRTAFHAARDLGLAYSIIDLPAVSVSQYLFLRGNGVEASLWEDTPAKSGQVRLLNAFAAHDPDHFKNSLFVNFDSFVEMARETQDAYFDLIRTARGDLLSINHECNSRMSTQGDPKNIDLLRFANYGYRPGPRHMFWEREGYITETFARIS